MRKATLEGREDFKGGIHCSMSRYCLADDGLSAISYHCLPLFPDGNSKQST